jgi:DNA-directed RNA polymerase subunit omega
VNPKNPQLLRCRSLGALCAASRNLPLGVWPESWFIKAMARVTVEDCLIPVPNRFALVHLAAKRTKQLMKGSKPQVDAPNNKAAVVALREIAELKARMPEGWSISSLNASQTEELPPDQR